MGKVVVMDHPLIQHKIGLMRRTETGSKDFPVHLQAKLQCLSVTRQPEIWSYRMWRSKLRSVRQP